MKQLVLKKKYVHNLWGWIYYIRIFKTKAGCKWEIVQGDGPVMSDEILVPEATGKAETKEDALYYAECKLVELFGEEEEMSFC